MLKLLLNGFFLFLSFVTHAATVQPIELTDNTIQFLDKKPTTPAHVIAVKSQQTTIQTHVQADRSIQQRPKTRKPTQVNGFFNTPPTQSRQQNNANSPPEIAEFAVKLKTEYENTELVQQSLSTLYDARQLWDNVDARANSFSADIIFSLKLNTLLERDLANTHHPLQNSGAALSFLNKNNVFSIQQNEGTNISYNQILQTQDNTTTQELHILNSKLIAKLFSMTSVYYLIAIFIVFTILQWAIKFTLRLFP